MPRCPYAVSVVGVKSMLGCSLTEDNEKTRSTSKSHYQLCPSSCYDGPYERCPFHLNRDKTGDSVDG